MIFSTVPARVVLGFSVMAPLASCMYSECLKKIHSIISVRSKFVQKCSIRLCVNRVIPNLGGYFRRMASSPTASWRDLR
jgi:hypothetical protein